MTTTHVQPSLLDAPTLEEAVALADRAMAETAELADQQWLLAAEGWIKSRPLGSTFIAEECVLALAELGFSTGNRKAIGPVMKRMSRGGVIVPTGSVRRARTSHGAMKPVWRRA